MWHRTDDGEWTDGRHYATWAMLDNDRYGPLELLVPVPYTADLSNVRAAELMRRVGDAVLFPAADMILNVAQSAAAGVTSVVAEAYRRGRDDATVETYARSMVDGWGTTATPG